METKTKNAIEKWLAHSSYVKERRCPFDVYDFGIYRCEKYCYPLFPKGRAEDVCPCGCYNKEYVIQKARKLIKET